MTTVSEGKIIEIYNQELTQIMSVLQDLTDKIKILNSYIFINMNLIRLKITVNILKILKIWFSKLNKLII